ncbi:hypothetical protein BCR35DRAFT_148622 [Leucosporidium creatinivorum]|uniref:Uncharacterized protein n=1 Tax=Leucosporidium creatinivorum TaxID=106004 RepID=A0A1Y2EP98_9BASI|nr:hypothetical protein BCR35DRAFT_148622 [Leucosporidium creatinivorum]
MPLLPGGGGGSSSFRLQTDSSSAASFSDASSAHSYPPPPPRPGTTTSSTKSAKGSLLDGTGLEGWKNWAREMEAASAPPDRIRRKGSVGSDVPLDMWASRGSSSSSSSYGRTHASSQPSLISYALSSPSVNRSSLTASLNPLAPLRKRLARSLNSGRRAGVELQLLLELIDALEHYIRSADAHPPPLSQPPATPSTTSGSTSNSSVSLALEPSTPSPPSISTPLPSTSTSTSQPPRQTDVDLLSEIRSLVKELVECVPDAQLCLTTGLYGPLAFPSPSYGATTSHYGAPARSGSFSSSWPTMPLSTTASMVLMDLRDSGAIEWWPRRLVRDCRGLLEEWGWRDRLTRAWKKRWESSEREGVGSRDRPSLLRRGIVRLRRRGGRNCWLRGRNVGMLIGGDRRRCLMPTIAARPVRFSSRAPSPSPHFLIRICQQLPSSI